MSKIIFIEVAAKPVIPGKAGVSSKNGQPYSIPAKQVCYCHQGEDYPTKFEVPVPDSGPYRPGRYLIAGEAFAPTERGIRFDDRALLLVHITDAIKQLETMVKAANAGSAS